MKDVSLIICALGCALLLTLGCADKNKQNQSPTPTPPPPAAVPAKPSPPSEVALKAELEGMAAPNRYQVRLRLAANFSVPLIIYRSREDERPELLVTLEPSASNYVDESVAAGTNYKYFLGRNENAAFVSRFEAAVSVPSDMEVRGTREIEGDIAVGRLFLRKNSRLIAKGRLVSIEAGKILSEGAEISSFVDGKTAAAGAPGRSGGELRIRATSGQGVLNVVMRGESGGKGAPGAAGNAGSKGGRGGDGVCGYRDDENSCNTVSPDQLALLRRLAASSNVHRQLLDRFYCRAATGNGEQGNQGNSGGKGGVGAQGGNSGSLYVEVESPAGFEVRQRLVPGSGGAGGDGGAGGPGGPGGDPGNPDRLGICPPGSTGPQGLQGSTGPIGDSGPTGKPDVFCLRLGGTESGDCARFD